MNFVIDVLSCPTEIVVGIVRGRRKRLGSRDGFNMSKREPSKFVKEEDCTYTTVPAQQASQPTV